MGKKRFVRFFDKKNMIRLGLSNRVNQGQQKAVIQSSSQQAKTWSHQTQSPSRFPVQPVEPAVSTRILKHWF